MEHYSSLELADMHLIYGAAGYSVQIAKKMYREKFPNRHHPSRQVFISFSRRMRETGSLQPRNEGPGNMRTTRTPDFEEEVLERVAADPTTSTRRIARAMGAAQSSVWRVLHEQQLHPYHPQRVHALLLTDFAPRVALCQWLLQQWIDRPDYLQFVLFTDEASFTRDGISNSRNNHVWDEENPHAIVESHHQQRFAVNIWAGIVHDNLIGPYLLPARLNGHRYLRFLQRVLPELLEDVPLAVCERMWIQHDGAPPHFSVDVRNHLNAVFPGRWIGRGGPIPWPARSPDLNPLDYFLWGYLKSLVFETPVETDMELVARIVAACDVIRNTLGIFVRVRQNLVRRCHAYIEVGGRQFEQLLKGTKLCVNYVNDGTCS